MQKILLECNSFVNLKSCATSLKKKVFKYKNNVNRLSKNGKIIVCIECDCEINMQKSEIDFL